MQPHLRTRARKPGNPVRTYAWSCYTRLDSAQSVSAACDASHLQHLGSCSVCRCLPALQRCGTGSPHMYEALTACCLRLALLPMAACSVCFLILIPLVLLSMCCCNTGPELVVVETHTKPLPPVVNNNTGWVLEIWGMKAICACTPPAGNPSSFVCLGFIECAVYASWLQVLQPPHHSRSQASCCGGPNTHNCCTQWCCAHPNASQCIRRISSPSHSDKKGLQQ
jgi:hypothetical protein